jgi:23S rRNA (adenine2503-C2)-methyltransferase
MPASPACITDLTSGQMRELVAGMGEPDYRAAQLRHWVYQGLCSSFDEMSDLPRPFRARLSRETRLCSIGPVRQVAGRDSTIKGLFALADGRTIESALMLNRAGGDSRRYTVCVSTQVGCPVRCPFCATGQQGFERNLSPGEIVDQVLYFARLALGRGGGTGDAARAATGRITNVVFMGMGEPLANYDAVLQAVRTLTSPEGFGLAGRGIVISTAGLVPQIKKLSREGLLVGLAVSLHASEDKLRSRLVPMNKRYPLERLLPACREFRETTGRRVSFEYVLFEGVNDSLVQARSLGRLLKGLDCHVNLIPANPTAGRGFGPPPRGRVLAFQEEVSRSHIACTVRRGRGLDIDAGCGQLRSRLAAGVPPGTVQAAQPAPQ